MSILSTRWARMFALAALIMTVFPITAASTAPDTAWSLSSVTSPFSWYRFDGEVFGKNVFFLGGRNSDNTTDGHIWFYNTTTQVFRQPRGQPIMPVPVTNYTIAKLLDATGQGAYLFGGRPAAGGVTTTVQVYYPTLNISTTITTDPLPLVATDGNPAFPGDVVVVNNKAYAFGGVAASTTTITAVGQQTWIYDPAAPAGSRWTQGPDLRLARGYISGAVANNRFIYAIGGDTWDSVNMILVPQAIVERLDTANLTRGWRPVASLPTPSSGIAGCDESRAFTVGTSIYLAGCGQWPSTLADSFKYDVLTNTWSTYDPLNQARRNHAGFFLSPGGVATLYVLGGIAPDAVTTLNTMEINTPGPVSAPIGRPSSPGTSQLPATTY